MHFRPVPLLHPWPLAPAPLSALPLLQHGLQCPAPPAISLLHQTLQRPAPHTAVSLLHQTLQCPAPPALPLLQKILVSIPPSSPGVCPSLSFMVHRPVNHT